MPGSGDRVQLQLLHPLPEQRVRRVLGEGDVLDLVVDVRERRAVREERSGAGPAAVLIGGDATVDGGLQCNSIDKVA
jgi:hypothetical protein